MTRCWPPNDGSPLPFRLRWYDEAAVWNLAANEWTEEGETKIQDRTALRKVLITLSVCEICQTTKKVRTWSWESRRTFSCPRCAIQLREAWKNVKALGAPLDKEAVLDLVIAKRLGKNRNHLAMKIGQAYSVQEDGREELKALTRHALKDKHLYERHMSSPEWRKIRRRFLAKRERKCAACGARSPLHVHHRTYDRLGHEGDDDLRLLCQRCHLELHRYQRESGLRLEIATDMFLNRETNATVKATE